jgi:hypothetical protein
MNIAGFNEARLAAQYETFGEPAIIGGLSCVVCATGHRGTSQLEDGGFTVQFARTVRVRYSDLPKAPKVGATAQVSGKKYRVADVTDIHQFGEYILGLEAAS